MEIELQLDLSIRQQKFGMSQMANCYQHIAAIQPKLYVYPLIILVKDFVQALWTTQPLYGI